MCRALLFTRSRRDWFGCYVIACDKREAFAQGSTCDEAIQLARLALDCFASLAMTA
jgi:hypothetical protein